MCSFSSSSQHASSFWRNVKWKLRQWRWIEKRACRYVAMRDKFCFVCRANESFARKGNRRSGEDSSVTIRETRRLFTANCWESPSSLRSENELEATKCFCLIWDCHIQQATSETERATMKSKHFFPLFDWKRDRKWLNESLFFLFFFALFNASVMSTWNASEAGNRRLIVGSI